MMTESTRFDSGLGEIIKSFLLGVHTCLPGRVDAFNRATQRCEVVPCLKRKYASQYEAVELPKITDVPVVFPGSGDRWLVTDITVGSYVLLVVAERSISSWLTLGGIADPGGDRAHDLSDAFAIAGIFPTPDTLAAVTPGAIAMRSVDGTKKIELGATGIVTINAGTRAAAAVGDTVVADNIPVIGTDLVFFAWVAAVSTALGLPTAPTTLTSKITTGSAEVLIP